MRPPPRVPLLGFSPATLRGGAGRIAWLRRGGDRASRRGARPLGGAAGLDIDAALGGVVLEVAGVQRRLAAVHLDDRVGDAADQVSVVGDQHHRAAEGIEGVLQDVAGLDVEVVRRLVEAQEIGRIGEELGEGEAGLLAAGQHADLLLDRVAGEEEGAEQPAHLGGRHHRCRVVELREDGVGRVERLDLVLREVRHAHVRAELAGARIGLEHAGQHLQQRALAGPVRTDERHPLPALEGEVQVAGVDHGLAVALRDVLQRDHRAAAERGGSGNRNFTRLRPPLRLRDPLEPLERLDARLDLARLGLLVAEPIDERLGVGDLALLGLGRGLELGDPLGALVDEVRVVADVLGRAAVVELDDPVGDLVDEVAVVADQHDRPGVLRQEAGQPLDRCQVEVVGRLVEQQDVGVLEQQPRERHPHHPAAAERADVALHVTVGESEPGEDAARLGLEPVAAERLEPMLDAAVLVHQLGELVVVVRRRRAPPRCGAFAARSR